MRRYDAEQDDDTLTATLRDSSLGGVDLVIQMSQSGLAPQTIHMSNHTSYEEAERELVELFPGMKWR